MVRAWIADVTPLYEDGCYREYYGSIPDFRKKKADALRTVEMKAQSVGAWTLWEQIRSMMVCRRMRHLIFLIPGHMLCAPSNWTAGTNVWM